jgi:hypothetical protein
VLFEKVLCLVPQFEFLEFCRSFIIISPINRIGSFDDKLGDWIYTLKQEI